MNIVYDHQIFTIQKYGGISKYITKLGNYVNQDHIVVSIIAPLHVNKYLATCKYNVIGKRINRYPPRSIKVINKFNDLLTNQIIKKIQPSVIHETYYSMNGIKYKAEHKKVLTVHDMIHEVVNDKYYKNGNSTSLSKRIAIERADHIIAISNNTKNDLCNIFGIDEKKITVVYHGVENNNIDHRTREHERPYILFVGGRRSYKNFDNFIRAYSSKKNLNKYFDIILFGDSKLNREELKLISRLKIPLEKITHMSGSDDKLANLYAHANCLVYPSYYEGFGLPPLEAMLEKCPVVVSNRSSIPEVVGEAGEYFDPSSVESIADSIEKVLYDKYYTDELIKKGLIQASKFTWEKCAEKTLEVYKK